MRKVPFVVGEFYHIYNRGTDHRYITKDGYDKNRFLQSMIEFNVIDPIGSIYALQFNQQLSTPTTKSVKTKEAEKLVNIIAYCLNPNHYHLILEEVSEKGIEKFIQKLGGGYTRYFNERHHRTGVLFQGKFKAVHISSDEYLLYLSAYVNLNYRIHKIPADKARSSWDEYIGKNKEEEMCSKDIILNRFKNKNGYQSIAEDTAEHIKRRRESDKKFEQMLIE